MDFERTLIIVLNLRFLSKISKFDFFMRHDYFLQIPDLKGSIIRLWRDLISVTLSDFLSNPVIPLEKSADSAPLLTVNPFFR